MGFSPGKKCSANDWFTTETGGAPEPSCAPMPRPKSNGIPSVPKYCEPAVVVSTPMSSPACGVRPSSEIFPVLSDPPSGLSIPMLAERTPGSPRIWSSSA